MWGFVGRRCGGRTFLFFFSFSPSFPFLRFSVFFFVLVFVCFAGAGGTGEDFFPFPQSVPGTTVDCCL